MGRGLGNFNKKGVDDSRTKGYKMREADDAKAYLKFEENVIVCLRKSVAKKIFAYSLLNLKRQTA